MKRSELNKLYRKVAQEIGFKEDPAHKGWMPRLGPNDYKCKITHGFTDKGPVTLTAGPRGFVDPKAWELAINYALAKKKISPCIILPKVWSNGNFEDRSWVVRERVDGAQPLVYALEHEISELYWNTVKVFSELEPKEEIGISATAEDWFRGRLNKWLELGESDSKKSKGKKQKYEVFRRIANNAFLYLAYETDLLESANLEMELFFKNFGNTDIVFNPEENKFYLPVSDIDLLPQFYGTAYFVWNLLMHGDENFFDALDALDGIDYWHDIFKEYCPKELKGQFSGAFFILLLERVLATLLVDILCWRSPFDVKKTSDEKVRRTKKIFVTALQYLLEKLPTLVAVPFGDDILKLRKIYGK